MSRHRRLPFLGSRGSLGPAQRDEQLAALASSAARAAHSGSTLLVALDDASSQVVDPLRWELESVMGAVRGGATLDEALRSWSDSANSSAVELFVAAARIGHAQGGQLATAMDGVAIALSDRGELQAEARAQSAQARLSVRVLVGLPVVGLASFAVVEPRVVSTLLGTPVGLACLVTGTSLDVAGAVVASRIVARALR